MTERTQADVLAEVTYTIEQYGTESAALYAERIAKDMLLHAEPRDGRLYLELNSRYTKDGHPLPMSFRAYAIKDD